MFATAAATATETVPWLDQLNPEQRAAATHPGGPLLILAGAGTGKTTTLCSRVAWLVNEGVAPERILLLTFTRRAAREMPQRARALSQGRAVQSLARATRDASLDPGIHGAGDRGRRHCRRRPCPKLPSPN